MLKEVLSSLDLENDPASKIIIDGTFGGGGYSEAILKTGAKVIAFDRDPSVISTVENFKEKYQDQFHFIHSTFGQMESEILKAGYELHSINGIVLDIGVSSMQLDECERGFSFRFNGPLDMRMSKEGMTAADIVNNYEKDELADIIWKYGEERKSRHIASAIVQDREEKPFQTTEDLANLVRSVVKRKRSDKIDPATRTFQALRMEVNGELEELENVLASSKNLLAVKGRMVVVAFHSLEDRIVKRFFKNHSAKKVKHNKYKQDENITDDQQTNPTHEFSMEHTKHLSASEEEINLNARSRSAKLRYGIRTNYGI